MSLDFTAIDFETANPKHASACSVGLARVRDGQVIHAAGTLIMPPAGFREFSPFNTGVHGITAAMVADAPDWRRVADWIRGYVADDLLVAHNAAFDMSVLRKAHAAEQLAVPGNQYLCTLQLARRACRLPSNRLPDVAAEFGVRLTAHHDAVADARCAAEVAVAMARRHGHDKLEQLAQSLDVPVRHLAALPRPPAPSAAAQRHASRPRHSRGQHRPRGLRRLRLARSASGRTCPCARP